MNKITSQYFYVLLTVLFVNGQEYTSVIDTASGPVRGLILTSIENLDYAAFKGIPYAKPPIGYLRFKPPVEVDKWTKVYNATIDRNVCTQATGISISGSEDCLFINIYTPHTSFNEVISKPVIVWIHGGGFMTGDSHQPSFGPDYILGEDVILVTFNYRLGAFGFLNIQHENATGNAGLKDQNLALKWVRKNIAQFGGNPDKVTLFGLSAGGASTDYHALSDMSQDLFSQSISMSGSPLSFYWSFQRREEALHQAILLGSKLGTKTNNKDVLLKVLYKASAVEIATAAGAMDMMPFRPTLENSDIAKDQEKFLTQCTPMKYASGNYSKIPHLMGYTSDEGISFFRDYESYYHVGNPALQLLGNLPENVPFFTNLNLTLAHAKAVGLENMTQAAVNKLKDDIGELLFVLGVDAKQKFMSRNNNNPIYYYRFSFVPTPASRIKFEGAGHADDQAYLFHIPSVGLPLNQPDIVKTRRRMVKLWTNFAKYGNPTPDGENDKLLGLTWPDSRSDGAQLDIGTNLKIGTRLTSKYVENLELFGLGSSLFYNDCADN